MTRRDLLHALSTLTGGAALAPAALTTLLHACAAEDRRTWRPAYLNAAEADFLSAFVDTLLPRTDLPGGLDVGVDAFIDKVLALTTPDPEAPSPLRDGIREFDAAARERYGRPFAELAAAEREEMFADAEARSPRFATRVWGKLVEEQPDVGFYRSLKASVAGGYLSSEPIGREVLNYDPVPGEYDGDIALASVGGLSWSGG